MSTSQDTASRRRRTREEVGRLVRQFEASGLPAAEFCRTQGLAPSTLRRRLQKQLLAPRRAEVGVRLVAVKVDGAPPVTEGPSGPGLEVTLAGGRRIGVAPGFDAATLSRLVRALEAL